MAGDATTIARPYAEAIVSQAQQTQQLGLWSSMLELLATVLDDASLQKIMVNPGMASYQKADLILDIVGDQLSQEGKNLVRLLAQNQRLMVLPEICALFQQYQAAAQGVVDVEVTTAYALESEQTTQLACVLQKRLGKKVHLQSQIDASLIGGFRVRAGDFVIDGSVAGQLKQLSQALGTA